MQKAPDHLSGQISKRNRLRRAVEAVVDLLDPDFEPRSYTDTLNFLLALELAIDYIHERPEFRDLDGAELQQVHERTLEAINW
ncbi:MAG TPA: hypothetical protein VMU18_04725 [Rhodoblastus sp.]|nr:hypothetical protein [Rhodoblastus sp.]